MFTLVPSQAEAQPATFTGPLQLHQTVTLYLVNPTGVDFTMHLRWHDVNQTEADRPRLIRVFDPDERLILRHEESCERVDMVVPQYSINLPVDATAGGVYQVPVVGFGGNLEFSTTPPLSWGVMGSPWLAGRGGQFEQAWVYLPPKLDNLPIAYEGTIQELRLTDEFGVPRLSLSGTNKSGQVALPTTGVHVWKVSVIAQSDYRMDFRGLPIILCPDQASALAIRSSVDVVSDGTICFHKFQKRAWEKLRQYREMPLSDFSVTAPTLLQYKNEWKVEAARNELLLGAYGVYSALPATLREQNLDPTSPWFGSIFVWRDLPDHPTAARPENPWARYDRLGLSRTSKQASVFAAVYSINKPFNPLYKNPALLKRIIIASLQELMLLREHEIPLPVVPDNYYGGERSAIFGSFLRSFPLVVKDCPNAVRTIWTDGLRRYVDHESVSQVSDIVNQWAVMIKGFLEFAEGTGEEIYFRVAMKHVKWLLARTMWDFGQQPAGYYDECGPDATYVGISTHYLSWLYKQLEATTALQGSAAQEVSELAAELRESIRQCFNLFSHTLVPQRNGTYIGATNFNTRTANPWTETQFGGGIGMMADELPEAAPLVGRVWPTMASLDTSATIQQAVVQSLLSHLTYLNLNAYTDPTIGPNSISGGADLHFAIWEHFANPPLPGALPMSESTEFTRNFGDEFFCVRRPNYYAFLYAGTPMPQWAGGPPADARKQFPRNGGGLSAFWSPGFGTSLLAQNWSVYSAQTIIAERNGSSGNTANADWEDYWSVANSFDTAAAETVTTGTVRNQQIAFERCHYFKPDYVDCTLELRATGNVTLSALWECFPYPIQSGDNLNVTLVKANGSPPSGQTASAIVFRNGTPEAHIIVFAQPRKCKIGTGQAIDNYNQPHTFGRVLAELPAELNNGEVYNVHWCVMAVPANQVTQAVQAAIARMNQ